MSEFTQSTLCARLPVALGSGSQPGRQPAPSPCLGVSVGFSHKCSANFSSPLACPLYSDSSPKEISAKEEHFLFFRLDIFDSM